MAAVVGVTHYLCTISPAVSDAQGFRMCLFVLPSIPILQQYAVDAGRARLWQWHCGRIRVAILTVLGRIFRMEITLDSTAPCGIRPNLSLSTPRTQGCSRGISNCRTGCTKPISIEGRSSLRERRHDRTHERVTAYAYGRQRASRPFHQTPHL